MSEKVVKTKPQIGNRTFWLQETTYPNRQTVERCFKDNDDNPFHLECFITILNVLKLYILVMTKTV